MKIRLATLAIMFFAVAAKAGDYLPEDTPLRIPVPQAAAMDRNFPRSADCDALRADYIAAGWPMGAGIETLRGIDARLKRQLVMRNDAGPDVWTPLATAIVAGKRPAGDCDDISVTSAQLAICAGMPPEDVGVLITTSPKSAYGCSATASASPAPCPRYGRNCCSSPTCPTSAAGTHCTTRTAPPPKARARPRPSLSRKRAPRRRTANRPRISAADPQAPRGRATSFDPSSSGPRP